MGGWRFGEVLSVCGGKPPEKGADAQHGQHSWRIRVARSHVLRIGLDPPRKVGGSGVSQAKGGLGHALRRCLKGLRKLHPSDPNHRKKASQF